MTAKDTIIKIEPALAKYGFSARENGATVEILNKKNQLAARITDGQFKSEYQGQKNMCGSLVKNDVVALLNS